MQKTLAIFSKVIKENSNNILVEWRNKVKLMPIAKDLSIPTLNDHIPDLINELANEVAQGEVKEAIIQTAELASIGHGLDRLKEGFNVEEVVTEYNIFRQIILELAERNMFLNMADIGIINRTIDTAIALAIKTFTDQKNLEIEAQRKEHLSFVAHDLRNPLTSISLATYMLKKSLLKEGIGAGESHKYLERINTKIEDLDDLLVQVVQEDRNLVFQDIKLKPMAEKTLQNMQPLAELSNTVLVNHIPEELMANADAYMLNLIFQNLISNAINYTEKGTVTVGGAKLKESAFIECWVRDTGVGIKPESLGKIFEKFETSSKKGGLGLGLVIVKKFVEANKGQITVGSKVGSGTTFRFTLPAVSGQQKIS